MTHTLIVAAREVRERSFVLLTAVFIAALPFAAALLPAAREYGLADLRAAVGGILAIAFALGVAIVLGSTMVGRELSERRLPFYFARPLHGSAIWFGKLAGALALVGVSFAIIFIPAVVSARAAWRASWNVEALSMAAVVLAVSVFLVTAAHAISTIVRSRSALVAVDLIAAAAVAAATWGMVRLFGEAVAVQLAAAVGGALIVALTLALIGAGAWQLSHGRGDVRRSHREMSKFLWITMAVALALAGAYTTWVFSAGPRDLVKPRAEQSARGDWALVGGLARARGDYAPFFLINPRSGESKPFLAARWWGGEFTRAGDAIVSKSAPVGFRGRGANEIVIQRLRGDEQAIETGITTSGTAVLSDDLRRLAVIDDKTVAIHDLENHRLVASAPMPGTRRGTRAFFVTPDLLRIVHTDGKASRDEAVSTLTILELDARRRALTETGRWVTSRRLARVQASADGSALLVTRVANAGAAVVLDGRTGAVRRTLPADSAGYWNATMLSDGRTLTLTADEERVLKVFTPDGEHVRDIALGSARGGRVVGETGSRYVVVAQHQAGVQQRHETRRWEMLVVDIDGGKIVHRERRVAPADSWGGTDPRVDVPNTTGEFVVTDADGQLWLWNVLSGEKKKFL